MSWLRSTFGIALVGSLLYWAALPPLALGPLGWIAPVPWLLLVRAEAMPGRRPYRALWLAGLVLWLSALHWLRLPHPATSLGWVALSAYLACYLPVFVGLSRVAVHRLRVPLWLAAPIAWTGLELARAHLLTGFLMASLSHTQVHWPAVIQLSDLVGQYGVDFLMMLVAASVASVLGNAECGMRSAKCTSQPSEPGRPRPRLTWPPTHLATLAPAILAFAAAIGYGYWRMGELDTIAADAATTGPRVAIIQGNSLAEWKQDPERERDIMDEYVRLSREAVTRPRQENARPVDLVIWPETMFRNALISFAPDYPWPPDAAGTPDEVEAVAKRDLAALVAQLGTPVLVGIDRVEWPADGTYRAYNSAVLVDRAGQITGTYDKVHLVVFGEYIPFADWIPFLYRLTPLTGGMQSGTGPVGLHSNGVCYAPDVCYESVLPHVIRRQVAELDARSERPDVLVNLTNDAWYWGSSELDMHLACDVFRAVECRLPMIVAANGGLSAWIDRCGRIRAQGPRQQSAVILADVELADTPSYYVQFGDWFAGVCAACCVALAAVGLAGRYRRRHQTA